MSFAHLNVLNDLQLSFHTVIYRDPSLILVCHYSKKYFMKYFFNIYI